jgi:hypothetical protein
MNAKGGTPVLMCRTGELAGSKFELGAANTIGCDAENRILVATASLRASARYAREFRRPLSKRYARIFLKDRSYYIEKLADSNAVTVDGTAIAGRVALDRLHVIGIDDVAEFVYRHAAEAQHQPALASDTVVETRGFGTMPELRKSPGDDDALPPAHVVGFVEEPVLELLIDLPGTGQTTFRLKHGVNFVGSGADCDIRIAGAEKTLSRRHAVVRVTSDRVVLVDLKGEHGTFVNGRRTGTAVLTAGVSFRLGQRYEFTLRKR